VVVASAPWFHRRVSAWFYAALHRGHPGDVAFYREACAGAGEVLELGVGYGRLAWPLAEAGLEVTGIDHDPGLLALARRRGASFPAEVRGRVTLLEGDMCALELDRTFDRIIIPYSGLHCLLDGTAVARCFRGVAEHLEPGGRLILDTYLADDLHGDPEAEEGEGEAEPLVTLEVEGRPFAVSEQVTWHRLAQRLDTTYHAVPDDGGPPLLQLIEQRYLLQPQLEAALEKAGLVLSARYGDFDGRPLTPSSDLRVVVAQKPMASSS